MEKKPQNTAGNGNENPAPQGSKWLDETIIRDIVRALVLLIVFAWALVNLDAVLRLLTIRIHFRDSEMVMEQEL